MVNKHKTWGRGEGGGTKNRYVQREERVRTRGGLTEVKIATALCYSNTMDDTTNNVPFLEQDINSGSR